MIRKKKGWLLSWMVILSTIVSGCLYPQNQRVENQVPIPVYLEQTQKAMEEFQKTEGGLPIYTTAASTPYFEKYEIDFKRLIPRYLPDIPGNAFEKGGPYKYVIIDVEDNPKVRLIDLREVSKVTQVQHKIIYYVTANNKLPIDQDLGNSYYSINYTAIGATEPQIESPFSDQLLPLIMNKEGQVGINYASDIASMMREQKITVPKDTDPRYAVARESFFVPFKSFPYKLVNNEPELLKY
ncbi:hypothetical protein [Brevibacillus daliensis]|uniref:hypothetical protein n=1 Tax=Brevibacillus daliensis TaxID=2892995 RepID=UPI001E468DEC|nr:hypothetical protein [Brevibacillus daliensis]